jgi:hypothetical protein
MVLSAQREIKALKLWLAIKRKIEEILLNLAPQLPSPP